MDKSRTKATDSTDTDTSSSSSSSSSSKQTSTVIVATTTTTTTLQQQQGSKATVKAKPVQLHVGGKGITSRNPNITRFPLAPRIPPALPPPSITYIAISKPNPPPCGTHAFAATETSNINVRYARNANHKQRVTRTQTHTHARTHAHTPALSHAQSEHRQASRQAGRQALKHL